MMINMMKVLMTCKLERQMETGGNASGSSPEHHHDDSYDDEINDDDKNDGDDDYIDYAELNAWEAKLMTGMKTTMILIMTIMVVMVVMTVLMF